MNDMTEIDEIEHVGYLPPINYEAEMAALGCLMRNGKLYDVPGLKAEHFAHHAHRAIFEAITLLAGERKPHDPLSVAGVLENQGQLSAVGGLVYITSLATDTLGNLKASAAIVQERALERAMLSVATDITALALERQGRPLHERQAQAQALLREVCEQASPESDDVHLGEAVQDAIRRTMARLDRGGELGGYSTGIPLLDVMLDGLRGGELLVIGGRPSMGKSALGLQFGIHCADKESAKIRYVSLEMPAEDLADRAVSVHGGIPLSGLRDGRLPEEYTSLRTFSSSRMMDLNFRIGKPRQNSVALIAAAARRQFHEEGLDMLVVDHLHLVKVKGENRAQAIGEATAAFKALALELGIRIILLAQLNRESAKGGMPREPGLADLRDSGSIEQDADVVILIHRPGYYSGKTDDNSAHLIVGKNRNGATGTVMTIWNGAMVRFEVPPHGWQPPSYEEEQQKSQPRKRGFDG